MRRYLYHTVISTRPIQQFSEKFVLKMIALRSDIYCLVVTVFIQVLKVVTSEPCLIFRTQTHVTMDTSQCLFRNFTEPVSKWLCLESCHNDQRVGKIYINIHYVLASKVWCAICNLKIICRPENEKPQTSRDS